MFNNKLEDVAVKRAGRIRAYFILPIYMCILLAVSDIAIFFYDTIAGFILFGVIVIYSSIYLLFRLRLGPSLFNEIVNLPESFEHLQEGIINDMDVPCCLINDKGDILWMNASMYGIVNIKDAKKSIMSCFPEITLSLINKEEKDKYLKIAHNKKNFKVQINKIDCDAISPLKAGYPKDSILYSVYFFDETELNICRQKIIDDAFVVGLIYIDNYEEALDSIDDIRRSLFVGLIDKRVNRYFASGMAIVRKLEKDKYIVVFRNKFLQKLIADKFSILEDIKSVKIGNEMTITLSVAIGSGAGEYAKNYEFAKAAMDLALGRGGDQAVVKINDKIMYYGAKSQQQEKNTRVKIRVKAHALRQILNTTDNVIVMGHSMADIDSFGACIGIYAICRKLGINVHIVINDITGSVKPFMNRFIEKEGYPEDMFVSKIEAPDYVTDMTTVIVVDVNKPSMTECPQLLEMARQLVVFDHHRQSSDPIMGAVLSYVDPYASSAAEMITEMIQYVVDDDVKIKAFEADALYAGIYIDTDGFHSKSGPRTFEAAAYLRRHGADVTRVRKMLRSDMSEYKAIAQAVSRSEVYRDCFAIAIFNGFGLRSPTVGGAKAANQLLDISGIKASFVVTEYNNRIFISARSIDEVNVQLIMEQLGGGGHMTIAGAQLTDTTTVGACNKIKAILDKMIADGDL